MISNIDTTGLGLFTAGLLIRYLIGWLRFSRRNAAGVQVFRSYFIAVRLSLLDGLGRLVASILIVLAIITILMRL